MLAQAFIILVLVTACGAEESKKTPSADSATQPSYVAPMIDSSSSKPFDPDATVKESKWTDKETGLVWMTVQAGVALTAADFRAKCSQGYELTSDVELMAAIRDGLFKALKPETDFAWGDYYHDGEYISTSAYKGDGTMDMNINDWRDDFRASFYCVSR